MINTECTSFSTVYDKFLSKVTDDMYIEMTKEDTYKILQQLLLSAIPHFEFPRQSLDYQLLTGDEPDEEAMYFVSTLTDEEVNVLATYMVVEWFGQQLASIELTRMKYSGAEVCPL